MLVVVLGPRTRLAKALLSSRSWGRSTAFVLVARTAAEYDAIGTPDPRATRYAAWNTDAPLPEADDTVAVVCCAFGVIHPESAMASRDFEKVRADYETLTTILRRYASHPVQLTFISSVLALGPRPGREYYAGWKNVVGALLRHASDDGKRLSVSILYPGRLVDTRRLSKPTSWLHMSYPELAEQIVSSVQRNQAREAVLGLDSRLWLARQSIRFAWSVLTGRR